jgi:hypothetical protein
MLKFNLKDEQSIAGLLALCTIVLVLVLVIDLHMARVLLARADKLHRDMEGVENAFKEGLGGNVVHRVHTGADMGRDSRMEASFVDDEDFIAFFATGTEGTDGGSGDPDLEVPEDAGGVE